MPGGALDDVEDIRIIDHDFKNDNWKNAAMEIQRFFDEGVTSYLGMEERGDYSRPHYQNVFAEHFEIVSDSSAPTRRDSESVEMFKSGFQMGFEMGFEDGVEWHRKEAERQRRRERGDDSE